MQSFCNKCLHTSRTYLASPKASLGRASYPRLSAKAPDLITVICPNRQYATPASSIESISPRRRTLVRDLPPLQNRWPLYVSVLLFACSAWAAFIALATNYERASSSVVRTLMYKLKSSEKLRGVLGNDIKPVPFLVGSDPWVQGHVNLLQGSVDVSFPIAGSRGTGTVLFTSIRRSKEAKFEVVRWKVKTNGQTIDLNELGNG